MRRVGISEGSLGAQNALPREHRFLRYARDHPRLSYFIHGVDAVAERPLISALSFGILPTLFAVAKSAATDQAPKISFSFLAWSILVLYSVSFLYQWARGEKKPDARPYLHYFEKLTALELEPAITWPDASEREFDTFTSWHSGHIAYLAANQRWEMIANLLLSTQRRFPLTSESGHLTLHLMHYVHRLRRGSHEVFQFLLVNWLDQVAVQPSAMTALDCAALFKPLVGDGYLVDLAKSTTENTAAFLALNPHEQQVVITHLSTGDVRSRLVLLSLLSAGGRRYPNDLLRGLLSELMLRPRATAEQQKEVHSIAKALLLHLLQQDAWDMPVDAAAWLCHLYGRGENIMQSLSRLELDFPEIAYERKLALSQHLLSRACEYVRLTPVPGRAPLTEASAFYYPSLLRIDIVRGQRVTVLFDDGAVVSELERKAAAVIGIPKDEKGFMSQLLGEDALDFNRMAVSVSFYLQLLSGLVIEIADDSYGSDEVPDGIRGCVLKAIIRANEDLAENEFMQQTGHRIGRNYTFFLLRSLLAAESMSLKKQAVYSYRALQSYGLVSKLGTLTANLHDLHPVAYAFNIRHGVVNLFLTWLQQLLALKDESADPLAFDLLIGAETDEYATLFKLVEGSQKRRLQIMSTMSDSQMGSYLNALSQYSQQGMKSFVFRSLNSCLWAQHLAKRPDRAWHVIRSFWRVWGREFGNVNRTFDVFGFIESEHAPYRSSSTRFSLMNPMLAFLVEHQPTGKAARIFLRFVETCRLEDIRHHLSIFAFILPINTPRRLEPFVSWLGDEIASDVKLRLLAMLIFAVHPPEYFAPYENSWGLFQKKPVLFSEEVKQILLIFGRDADLNTVENEDVSKQLIEFGFSRRWVDGLKAETAISDRFVSEV